MFPFECNHISITIEPFSLSWHYLSKRDAIIVTLCIMETFSITMWLTHYLRSGVCAWAWTKFMKSSHNATSNLFMEPLTQNLKHKFYHQSLLFIWFNTLSLVVHRSSYVTTLGLMQEEMIISPTILYRKWLDYRVFC